jgi:nitroimidazol reductase NimA-like FMN-containing flavoprotein (pyridoxamine 5'-phosphate oxidase superfamily)
MVVQQMTVLECRAMFARGPFVQLACARNNQPYVVSVHVDMDGAYLYSYTG